MKSGTSHLTRIAQCDLPINRTSLEKFHRFLPMVGVSLSSFVVWWRLRRMDPEDRKRGREREKERERELELVWFIDELVATEYNPHRLLRMIYRSILFPARRRGCTGYSAACSGCKESGIGQIKERRHGNRHVGSGQEGQGGWRYL